MSAEIKSDIHNGYVFIETSLSLFKLLQANNKQMKK